MTEWLSTKQASAELGVGPRLLYGFVDSGELPAYRFGRVYRFKRADIDTFVETLRVKPGDVKHLTERAPYLVDLRASAG